jgi:hypothetical protein
MKREDSMMRNVAKRAGAVVVVVLMPATCWAHPGHGAEGGGWSVHHYFTEPVHLVGGALGLAGLLIGASLWRVIRAHRTRAWLLDPVDASIANQQKPSKYNNKRISHV